MEMCGRRISGHLRATLMAVVILLGLLCVSGVEAHAYTVYFRFNGTVNKVTGLVDRSPYTVGDQLNFLFSFETSEHGTMTRADGTVLDQGSLTRYAEYLGGDAILTGQFNAKNDYTPQTAVEYNYFKYDINLKEYSGALTENIANSISLGSNITGNLGNWIDAAGTDRFSMHQLLRFDDTISSVAYFIETLTLMEVSESLEDMDLSSITMKSTATPIPGAVWLLGAGLVGLIGVRRRSGDMGTPA